MSKSKSLIPQSKAKTVYGLLTDVRKVILAEPKRYDQSLYLTQKNEHNDHSQFPACGTIGCVAGWMVATTHPNLKSLTTDDVSDLAAEMLGGKTYIENDKMREELFVGDAVYKIAPKAQPGTPAYAKAGARHIARFQKRHEKHLRAQRLTKKRAA